MSKLTTNTINSRYGSTEALNNNFSLIEEALENTLSRDGTGPNYMEANLDMNSNAIVNASTVYANGLVLDGIPVEAASALSRISFETFSFTATANQTTFSVSPYSPVPNGVRVTVNGLQLPPADISTSGNNVVIPACTVSDEVVIEVYGRELSPSATINTYSFTASAGQTSFGVGSQPLAEGSVVCVVNGLTLPPTDLSLNGNNVIIPARSLNDEVVFYVYTRDVGASPTPPTSNLIPYTPAGISSVTTTVKSKLDTILSVKDFGAVGDGITDDSAAFQRAIDYAATLTGTASFIGAQGVGIYVPHGNYLINSTVYIRTSGVGLYGAPSRGSRLFTTSSSIDMFVIGDATDTSNIFEIHFAHLYFEATQKNATATTALKVYRTFESSLDNCTFHGWYQSFVGYRANRWMITRCNTRQNRTNTRALSSFTFQGLPSGTGGGIHLTNCEMAGNEPSLSSTYSRSGNTVTVTAANHGLAAGRRINFNATSGSAADGNYDVVSVPDANTFTFTHVDSGTTSGNATITYSSVWAHILVKEIDGFYITGAHTRDCDYGLLIEPTGNVGENKITDIRVVNTYFDNNWDTCVGIEGAVNAAVGDTYYQFIMLSDSLIRGSNTSRRCVNVDVRDGTINPTTGAFTAGTFASSGKTLEGIQIDNCILRQAGLMAVRVRGANASRLPVHGLLINNSVFERNNDTATATTSGIECDARTSIISNNYFGADENSATRVVRLTLTNGDQAAEVINNDCTLSNCTSVEPIDYTQSSANYTLILRGNSFPGKGITLDQEYKLVTTDATPADIWSFVAAQGQAGYVEIELTATTSDGAQYVSYTWSGAFKRDAGGTSLDGGAFTAGRTYKSGSVPAPTATLATNTLKVTVTGIAATTIQWSCSVKMKTSR